MFLKKEPCEDRGLEDWNRMAVQWRLAGAEQRLGFAEIEDVREEREISQGALSDTHKNYTEWVTSSRSFIMADEEQVAFQKTLDILKVKLRLISVSVRSVSDHVVSNNRWREGITMDSTKGLLS